MQQPLTGGAHATAVHPGPCSREDASVAPVPSLAVSEVVEGRQAQVNVVLPALLGVVVGDVGDDKTAGLAVVAQDTARTAAAEEAVVARGSVEGVCRRFEERQISQRSWDYSGIRQ